MILVVFCLAVVLVNGENHKIQTKPINISQGMEILFKAWYPEDAEFNESCVSEGCPALKNFSLCLNNIDITVLHSVLKTSCDCMRKPICGILIDTRPTPGLNTSTEGWLPGMEVDGTTWTIPGTAFLCNISNMKFEMLSDRNQVHQLPLLITMLISDMRAFGIFKLDLSLRRGLTSILGQALSVSIPRAKYDVSVEFTSTISINRSSTGSDYDIKLLNPIIKSHAMFCGVEIPEGFPNILTLITTMTKNIVEKSSWAVKKAAFLEKYFQNVIRIVTKLC